MDNQQPSVKQGNFDKMPKKNKGFIYMYTSPSGKKYIGQTTQSLKQRAKNGGNGYKNCSVFYKAIKKYGWKNFQVEILEEAPIELLDEKEMEWIEFYNTFVPNGYNISSEGLGHSKQIFQYDCKKGNFLKSYPSLTEAVKQNSFNSIQPISDCLHNRQKQAYGYFWTTTFVERIDPINYFSPEKKKVYAYNLDGSFFEEFDSITQGSKETNTNRGDIGKCLKGKIRYANGLIWTFEKLEKIKPIQSKKGDPIPVKQIDNETGKVIKIFCSQSEAARELGLSRPTGISRCCNGKLKTCAGFRWEFCEGSTTKYSQGSES